jgi:hypothetical protein
MKKRPNPMMLMDAPRDRLPADVEEEQVPFEVEELPKAARDVWASAYRAFRSEGVTQLRAAGAAWVEVWKWRHAHPEADTGPSNSIENAKRDDPMAHAMFAGKEKRIMLEQKRSQLNSIKRALGVAPSASLTEMQTAFRALVEDLATADDPREQLRDLVLKRASEKNIPFAVALTEEQREHPDLALAARDFHLDR